MSDSYVLILVLYTLASFSAVLAIAEAFLWLVRKPVLRSIERFRPQDGVVAHVVVYAFPAVLAFLLTAFSAVPGYFHGEPIGTHEMPGAVLVALALVGLYALVAPLCNVVSMMWRTRVRTQRWMASSVVKESFGGVPLVEVGSEQAFVVAAGLVKKQIFVSSLVRRLLSPRELRAVLRHENAHCKQNHNIARLIVALTPRILSRSGSDEKLSELIEYAADDAVLDVPGDALNLASAVVALARQSATAAGMLYSALVDPAHTATLERRVERLVLARPILRGNILGKLAFACVAVVAATAMIGSLPLAQAGFRETLELLVR
ncbi:peptidase M48, Ste24p [Candidatus Koribacter versatilis Ellin345]|uniref:Peptidase M48, Ste24p n=1 Tax=Koribacter versatilis (strain Ellin345) TaxID=204669 RepID=Q1IMP7_KORVE|nr:M56 family metallopeptidase [Candidatus Koribacter versatilis]ABF41853.1 peptidase M48, Ste24p [Candidatus Koribacter versatilis Ellin345]